MDLLCGSVILIQSEIILGDAVFYRFLLFWWDFSANDGDFGFI